MIIILFVFLSIFSLCLLLWQASNLISAIFGSPCVMANKKIIRQALKLAGLKKDEIFYDLGFGNGAVLIEAAKMGAKARGCEISPFYYWYAKIRTFFWGRTIPRIYSSIKSGLLSQKHKREIILKYANIYNVDLSKADVVYCYLMPRTLEKLARKFKKELKPGSRLISVGFPINNRKPAVKKKFQNHSLYIYWF